MVQGKATAKVFCSNLIDRIIRRLLFEDCFQAQKLIDQRFNNLAQITQSQHQRPIGKLNPDLFPQNLSLSQPF